ncbi:hypothetical protein FRB94_000125 [Tulasnella sp. JGI-2019a]|nr:hypothetical protein FRB94_000125 [Tulasnella sp. JGI-2019a]KAG9015809.1 hypothetical protein FRB93_012374 [Tulasnella sp. JGI-2019a]KAG9039559.1 hypothetical protein FRB95_009139 [Tulasnella sp. JGI-2019a]
MSTLSPSPKGNDRAIDPIDDDSDVASPEELEELLRKAKISLAVSSGGTKKKRNWKPPKTGKIAPLDPGPSLPAPYFSIPDRKVIPPKLIKDPGVERVQQATTLAPKILKAPELNDAGAPLTKKEKRELRNATIGPQWFDLPAPRAADLPDMYKQVEAIRLRRAMDRKLFMRRDYGEKKGIKGLPKYFAIGKVVDTPTPFKSHDSRNLTRRERKRTAVEELLADQESRAFTKRKFIELQTKRDKKGPGNAFKRARKW